MTTSPSPHQPPRKPFYKSLYLQVLAAVMVGVLLGYFYPQLGTEMKPLGDAFIKLIKMLIAPIIFCTVVVGIAGMEDMKKVGKTGGYALLYFEVVSTLALLIGLVIVNVDKVRACTPTPTASTRKASPPTPPPAKCKARWTF